MPRLHARWAVEDAEYALRYVLGELKDASRDVKWAAEGVDQANQHLLSELTEHELAKHELVTRCGIYRTAVGTIRGTVPRYRVNY